MLKVRTLIKYLFENNPQASPARLTFFNYLSHFADTEALLTAETIENFFASCLDYAHWVQNRPALGQEVKQVLQMCAAASDIALDLRDVKWPQDTQLVELEHLSDLTDSVQVYLNSIYKKNERYRLLLDQNKKILAVVLHEDHSVSVRSFDRKMILRHGQLEPLRKDLTLTYLPSLDLAPNLIQKIEVSPFVTAQFQSTEDGFRGCLVRGYVFQKFIDLRGENLTAHPKLFYAVKRLEQHFIDRRTDPFYRETVIALEKTIELVKKLDPEAIAGATDILARAQNALEYVFAGDRMLGLLIRDLQNTLSSRIVETTTQKAEPIKWTQPTQSVVPKELIQQVPKEPIQQAPKEPQTSRLRNLLVDRGFDLTN
jgi:hypothetical protein